MDHTHCTKLIHPLAKGREDYLCTRPHFKDGFCRSHHPDHIAEKIAKSHRLIYSPVTEIEKAILLLVSSGYTVSKNN
jgi:hypothetical protein